MRSRLIQLRSVGDPEDCRCQFGAIVRQVLWSVLEADRSEGKGEDMGGSRPGQEPDREDAAGAGERTI